MDAVADREPKSLFTPKMLLDLVLRMAIWCVYVWNKRGQILTGAVVTDGIKKGVRMRA